MPQEHELRPLLRRPGLAQVRLHLLIVDIFPKSVGAQEKGVPGGYRSRSRLRATGFLAQHPQQAAAVIVVVHVHVGDLSPQEFPVGNGVVLGHLRQLPVRKAVEPGVPDVGPDRGVARELQRHGGGAHFRLIRLGLLAKDLLIGGLEQGQKPLSIQLPCLGHGGKQGVHRQGGGHLAPAVSPQAVRQDENALLRRRPEAVLVVVPSAPVGI